MGAEQKTCFTLDKEKCIKCGQCINTCSGMVLEQEQDGYPKMKAFERYGWKGCWRCQHCLAVCPAGAISIFGKKPENSSLPPPSEMGRYMEQLLVNRRSCRRFLVKMLIRKLYQLCWALCLPLPQVEIPAMWRVHCDR